MRFILPLSACELFLHSFSAHIFDYLVMAIPNGRFAVWYPFHQILINSRFRVSGTLQSEYPYAINQQQRYRKKIGGAYR